MDKNNNMEEIQLHLNDHGRGLFFLEQDGNQIAEMEVSLEGKNLTVFHTGVKPEFEGQGIAKKLLDHMADYARENQLKVIALCKYVHVQFSRHEAEYQDIWNKDWKSR
jgi:hypothetical protein